jgi:hypothetical protein
MAAAKITKRTSPAFTKGRNPFDHVPQGVIWGLIGCAMSFGISLVTERTHGTLVRLRMAPLLHADPRWQALSCFMSIMLVELMLWGSLWALACGPSYRCSRWPGCRRRSVSWAS